ncbi:MAG: hypothetical protein ACPGWM_09410, partial [Flavobacteriales bacterium]
ASFDQLDDSNNFLICFSTNNPNLITTSGAYNEIYNVPNDFPGQHSGYALILNLNQNTIVHASYLSENGSSNTITNCRVLQNGNLAISGTILGFQALAGDGYQTTSIDPRNSIVWILNPSLSVLEHSTLYDYEGRDIALFLDESSTGQIIVNVLTETPQAATPGAHSVPNSRNNIIGFSPDLSEIDFLGTFGGEGQDGTVFSKAFLIDKCDKIYVSGNANFNLYTSNMNLTPDAFTDQGGFYMASFEPEMADISFATLLGGNHTDGGISTYDEKGVVYQGVCSVLGDPFLTTDNAWDDSQLGVVELGLYKIDFQSDGAVSQFTTELNNPCAPVELQLNNHSTLGEYQWFLDDELFSSETSPSTLISEPGEHLVQLVTFNEESCNVYDTLSVLIDVPEPSDLIANWETTLSEDCDETSFSASFTGSNADELTWSFEGESSTGSTFDVLDTESGDYLVELTATDSICMVEE